MRKVMFDHSKLRGRIRELFGTEKAFAEELGMSPTSLSARLNNRTDFTIKEILRAAELLQLGPIEADRMFFKQQQQKEEVS